METIYIAADLIGRFESRLQETIHQLRSSDAVDPCLVLQCCSEFGGAMKRHWTITHFCTGHKPESTVISYYSPRHLLAKGSLRARSRPI